MSDTCWTIIPCRGDSGDAYQARALGRVPGRPGLTDTRGLGPLRYTADLGDDGARRAAEADGWRSGLAVDAGYAPLTAPPRLVVTAVPEPVLAPAPTRPEPRPPAPELMREPLPLSLPPPPLSLPPSPDHGAGPAAPRSRRPAATRPLKRPGGKR